MLVLCIKSGAAEKKSSRVLKNSIAPHLNFSVDFHVVQNCFHAMEMCRHFDYDLILSRKVLAEDDHFSGDNLLEVLRMLHGPDDVPLFVEVTPYDFAGQEGALSSQDRNRGLTSVSENASGQLMLGELVNVLRNIHQQTMLSPQNFPQLEQQQMPQLLPAAIPIQEPQFGNVGNVGDPTQMVHAAHVAGGIMPSVNRMAFSQAHEPIQIASNLNIAGSVVSNEETTANSEERDFTQLHNDFCFGEDEGDDWEELIRGLDGSCSAVATDSMTAPSASAAAYPGVSTAAKRMPGKKPRTK